MFFRSPKTVQKSLSWNFFDIKKMRILILYKSSHFTCSPKWRFGFQITWKSLFLHLSDKKFEKKSFEHGYQWNQLVALIKMIYMFKKLFFENFLTGGVGHRFPFLVNHCILLDVLSLTVWLVFCKNAPMKSYSRNKFTSWVSAGKRVTKYHHQRIQNHFWCHFRSGV